MFARVLYADQELAMAIDWLGLGALVVHTSDGRSVRGSAAQKSLLVNTVYELQRRGVSVSPNDPTCREVLQRFARMVTDEPPDSLGWRTAFVVGAAGIADGILQERGEAHASGGPRLPR